MSSSLRDEPTLASADRGDPHALAAAPARGDSVATAGETCTPVRFAGSRARLRRFVRREHGPVSLRRMLAKAVINGAVVPICFVGSFAVTATLPPFMFIGPGHAPPGSTGPLTAEQVVMDLIEMHGCWMGAAPRDMEGKMPGHAVVTWPGAEGPVYGGARAAKAGLEHAFDGKYPRMQVHGFCR